MKLLRMRVKNKRRDLAFSTIFRYGFVMNSKTKIKICNPSSTICMLAIIQKAAAI